MSLVLCVILGRVLSGMPDKFSDQYYMTLALDLARAGLGRVAPNPSVGCVIVRDGAIVGQGRTADGGRPHAEAVAVAQAGALAEGADVYVTLEPCAHFGQTPPCAQALIDAGVARVVVACGDPDMRVGGRGVQMLHDAGIQVDEGLCGAEAMVVNAGFFLTVTHKRPFVTLKMAVSADDKIAGAGGKPVQISAAKASAHMHQVLRAAHDAIVVGRGTVVSDDPLLTTRVDGVEHGLKRIVLGRDIPCGSRLSGVDDVIVIDDHDVKRALLRMVVDHGVTRLLVEGGASVMQAFLESGLWDELFIYRSPLVIGVDGVDAPDFGVNQLLETQQIGVDRLEKYVPQ